MQQQIFFHRYFVNESAWWRRSLGTRLQDTATRNWLAPASPASQAQPSAVLGHFRFLQSALKSFGGAELGGRYITELAAPRPPPRHVPRDTCGHVHSGELSILVSER